MKFSLGRYLYGLAAIGYGMVARWAGITYDALGDVPTEGFSPASWPSSKSSEARRWWPERPEGAVAIGAIYLKTPSPCWG